MALEGPLVACEVTGRMVPPEDLVVFQGKRVCAEGKAILLERLKGGLSAPGVLEKPTVWKRFGGMFVDNIIVGIIGAVLGGIIGGAFAAATGRAEDPAAFQARLALLQMGVQFIALFIGLFYYGGMHAKSGQTFGKKAAKTKVIMLDGSPVTSGAAYSRAFWWIGPPAIAQAIQSFTVFLAGGEAGIENPDNQGIVMAGLVVMAAGAIFALINVIVALTDKQQRSLHDKLAGTRVVLAD